MRLLESCTEWTFRFRALLFWRRNGASCIYYIYHLPANCYLRANRHFYLVHFNSGSLCLSTTKCCTVSIFQFLLMIINYTNKHWNTNIVELMLTVNYVDYEDDFWLRWVISWSSLRCKIYRPHYRVICIFWATRTFYQLVCIIYPAIHTGQNSATCSLHNIHFFLYTSYS